MRIDLVMARVRRGAIGEGQLNSPEALSKLARRLLAGRGMEGVELLSRPTMVTLSGQAGYCATGQDVPVSYWDAKGAVRLAHHSVGASVMVMPTLIDGGRIRVEVEPAVCFLRANDTGLHTVRVIMTKEVNSGEAAAITSAPYKETVAIETAVPLLCQLPGLGQLFRVRTTREEEYELVVLFTAWELRQGDSIDAEPKR
ncbi:MAG: hypothetical protein U0797_24355 [Gemmataceae bacterium]